MEIEFKIDLIDLERWCGEVGKLRRTFNIYPDTESGESTYRRVAIVLADLFYRTTGIFVENLENDFYLLAKKWGLNCNPLSPLEEKELTLKNYPRRFGSDDHFYPEFQKKTRIAIGLSTKEEGEVEYGVDGKMIVDFLDFVYRHSEHGFLCLRTWPVEREKEYFFDIKNGFEQIPKFIIAHRVKLREKYGTNFFGFYFDKALYSSPASSFSVMASVPCLFSDIDIDLPDVEERLEKYKIWPSIRLRTSPRGWHFYWLLKNPARGFELFKTIDIQQRLANLLGGDLNVCYISPVSRLPGYFNRWYVPPHFITYKTTSCEYSLEDFRHLPCPSPKSPPMESGKRMDSKLIIEFFRLLYRNCEPGLLRVLALRYSPGFVMEARVPIAYRKDAEKLDFKFPEGIDELPKIFEEYKIPPEVPWHLNPHFYFRPFLLDGKGEISQIPCLWIDCDRFTTEIEAKLKDFPPSISLQTSPGRYHFFWILKHPLKPKDGDAIIKIQQGLAKAFGGDSLLTWNLDYVSRVPGSVNMKHCIKNYLDEDPFKGIPKNAFEVTYSATQEEFELGDFGRLPHLTLTDHFRNFMRLTAWHGSKAF